MFSSVRCIDVRFNEFSSALTQFDFGGKTEHEACRENVALVQYGFSVSTDRHK